MVVLASLKKKYKIKQTNNKQKNKLEALEAQVASLVASDQG